MAKRLLDVHKQRLAGLSIKELVQAALLVAFLTTSAQIIVPMPVIPFTLQTAVICLIALCCNVRLAFITCALYLILGACGLPVFAGAHGGIAVILGPSGGYLIAFLVGACIVSAIRMKIITPKIYAGALAQDRKPHHYRIIVIDYMLCLLLLALCYIFGSVQLHFVAHISLINAVYIGVVPYVLFDMVKAAVAVFVAQALRKNLHD